MKKKDFLILLLGIFVTIYFFSYPMTVFWDSGHYATYLPILRGAVSWAEWDMVRGIVFPGILYISQFLFGETTMGIITLSFIFYLVMLLSVYFMVGDLFKNKSEKTRKIIKTIIITFLIIDPLIFGYFHSLLTEFVAISISCLMCYLSWKWIDIDFFRDKKNYIISSLIFAFGTVFSWHLKQPYVSITLFPLLISAIISIASNRKIKNIIQRLTTVFICLIMLVLSISVWNSYLYKQGVNIDGDRNVVAGFGGQLVDGILNFKTVLNPTSDDLKFLSKKTKDKIVNNLDEYKLINIYNLKGEVVDQDVLYIGDHNISSMSAMLFISKHLLRHPILVIDSYLTTYLSISDIYPKVSYDSGVTYVTSKEFAFRYCHENCTIGLSHLQRSSNIFYMPDYYYQNVANYEQVKYTPVLITAVQKILCYVDILVYKIIMVILPFMLVGSIAMYCKKKVYAREMSLSVILLGYSFMHIMVHVAVCANIDRYASPTFITILLGYFIFIYCFISSKRSKVSYNEKRK